MAWIKILNLLAVVALTFGARIVAAQSHDQNKPNFVIILADDLGFSDLGCYGGEIDTPNLDQLAANGLRFTNFYNTGRCWPTRGSLLTGYYAQQVRRDKLPGVKPSGGAGKRPVWAPLVPVRLRKAGYRCFHTGKWHIDGMPIQSGFDQSYFLNDQARFFSPENRFLNDKQLPAIPRGTDYYATIDLADHAIEVLKDHQANHGDHPFFHYIAFTAPHFPLQALPKDIEKYQDRYVDGWQKVRAERWKRIQTLGIVRGNLSSVEPETGAPYLRPRDVKAFGPGEVAFPVAWDSLSIEQQEFQTTKMAIHAAMVDRIDQEVGRIIQQLKAMKQFDNTLILFLSDNGCSSELMIRDDGHDPQASPGSADTHLCLGPGWATVSNTPFRKHKTWVHEGGISTPLIAHWPDGIDGPGQWRHASTHLIDIVPTVMSLAGQTARPVSNGPELPGKSLVPLFESDDLVDRKLIWWSHDNHSAIQIGNWKAVKTASQEWELYDMDIDRTETTDRARSNPAKLAELVQTWTDTQSEFIKDATDH